MSDIIPEADLDQEKNEVKEKVVTRENVWIIPDRYYLELDLTPSQALLLTILRQTGKKNGYSEVSYSYIRKYTKQKDDKTIAKDLDLLEGRKLVYIHRYMSRRGRRGKYVHQDNAAKYWSYLTLINQFKERKKFEEEFMRQIPVGNDPNDDPHGNIPEPESASGKNPYAASGKNPDAINTTYLHNRINDVTCKSPDGPAASDEASSAASSSNLKEELEQSYSAQDVAIGMKWYEMQSEAKRSSMKKPIACIIQALKGGYAQEEVAGVNQEVAAKLAQDRDAQQQRAQVKREMTSNERLAHQLIFKFSHCAGWRHRIDSKCFVIYNDMVEKVKDEETGASVCFMPDGTKRFGMPAVRVDFHLPFATFRDNLKDFFRESQWAQSENEARKEG